MEYLIGAVLAIVVFAFAILAKVDQRVFYPLLLIIVALFYILFAAMGDSLLSLAVEAFVAGLFLLLLVAGFKKNLWFVVAALAGHGLFDLSHHLFIYNPHVPPWWPGFCLAFDIGASAFLAILLMSRSRSARTM
jgi:hypothetical protein